MKLSDLIGYKPELKTKPKEDDSTLDAIIDPFIAGTGRMAEDAAGTFFRLTRGNRDPEEYRNDPDVSSIRDLENWGREVRESHTHEYEPQTWQWYLNQAAESVPEMLGMMTASTAAGTAVAPVVGTAGGIAAGALRSAPVIGRGVTSLGKAIQAYLRGNSAGSRVARAFTPRDARTFSAAEIGAGIEAELEAQGVYNQAIAAGMSVDDAERAAADARLKNFGIISLANAPAYNYLFGAPARQVLGMARPTQQGLLGRAGKFAGYNVLPESLEEGAQEIANQSALPFGYDPQAWLDSAIVGGLMGFGMGGVGAIGNRVINGATPSYEEQLETWRRVNSAYSQNEANKYARKKYETQHGDEIRRQSQYDATKDQMRGSGIDTFMQALGGQESGGDYNAINDDAGRMWGKYQISDDNWSAWAQDAGLPADAPKTPENQERIARNKMLEYYNTYGNWRDVASMWYSGRPTSDYTQEELTRPQYANGVAYPSIAEYVESVMTKFRDISSRGRESNPESSGAYLGENGKAENKYWIRQGDHVSLEGAHPDLPNAIDMLSKWYYDRTGNRLVVTAGTNGDHPSNGSAHGHDAGWKVDVNDWGDGEAGALTADDGGKGYLTDEFIAYGRSLGLGMNWEGDHIDVALDGTQWDGNGDNAGGFNPNVSTQSHADQLYNQRISEGVQRERTPEEPEKTLFDINAEDTTTPKLIEQFLTDTANTAISQNDAPTLEFINPLLNGNTFQDTPENRQAVLDRYGDELINYIQSNSQSEQPTQPQTPKTQTSQTQQSVPPKDKNQAIVQEGRRFLEELHQSNDQSKAQVAFQLQDALNKGNFSEVEKILNDNGRAIQQPQPAQPTQPAQSQQQPVAKNKAPQNILTQPESPKTISGNDKLIRQASKAVTPKTSREGKKRIGNAITRLANQNGIAIPDVDYTSLQNGSSKKITEWQNKLAQAGVFNSTQPTQPTQAQQDNTPTLSERIGQVLDEYNKKTRLDNWEAVKDNMQLRRPSLKNIDRRIEHGKPNAADISKRENWSDIPDWRGRTREDNLALRLQRQNDLKASQQRRISERMQKLDTNETPADAIGQDNPEVETYTTQSLQEIQAEQQRQQQEQERQKELRRKYSDIDSNENQTGQPARQINENIINPDEMIGGNIAQRIRDDEDARTRKISDRYIAEPNEGANTGQGKNLNPDEMIGNIAQTFARQKQPKPQKANQPEEIQPVKKESPQPKKPRSKAVYGHDTEVISDSRTPYKVKYKVVEADDLTTSHKIENGNVFTNNKYPAELQPRQRERKTMQAQLISMAGNLSPKDLMDSRNGNQGAPVVRNDGVVLNGNGRVAATRYAYKNGTTNGYKESLIQNAEKLGLNAEDISKMNQPVLVRELAEELTPEKINDLTTSQTGGSRMGAAEQAQADAKKLSSGTLARISQTENIDFTNNEGAEVTRAALQDIVANQNELNDLVTDDGRISQDGLIRLKRALFAKAYGDSSVIARMSESTDDNVRGITNALLFAAPSIANVQEHIENGTLHKYDLSSIVSAVKKLSDLRERGTPVSNYLKEQSLFAEHADSEETREILDTFDENKRSTKKIATFLKNIATKIQNQGDPRQESLFGKNKKIPLINLIRQAREEAENDRNIPLFSKRGSDVDTRIDNFVEDKDLTPQQKLLKSFGNKLGVKTIFFRNADGRFHGAHDGNTTYISVNPEMPLSKVFWHESLHWLKANNPELYKDLAKAAGITTAQRQAYLEKTGRTDIKTPDEINEEMLADQFEDAAKRTGLFQSIAGKNRGLIQRVVQWLKDTMNKFIDHFRNPDGKLTTKQAQAFADEFGRIANQLKDPNGNKIFSYNRRTRNIELADGRKVEDFSFDEKETRENIARAEREGTLKYSVGNNNNSSESLWHKAKNAMSSFFSTSEKRKRKIITDNLRRLNGYRILYGYVDGADDVVIDNLQKLIKSRNAYDWEKLLPVVSEGIAKNLRLNATQAQSNYIADWLTTGALNNTTSPEAKAFAKAMRDNPAMGEILLETRKIFEELANMDAWDSVKSTIAHRQNKTFWEKIKFFGKNFTEEVLDDLHPLQKIVDTAIKQAPPAVAEMIRRGVNVKQLAQIARGRGATADMMINGNADKIAKIRSELAAQYVGCYFDDFKTLKMIIESVGGDWEGLEAFALAKLSKEMYEKNRALKSDEEPYTPYMTEERANHIIQTGEAKFGEAQKDLVRFSKILAAMEYDAGLITDATFARFMKGWKEYIPTPRVWDENEDYNKIDFMKAKRGHTDDTWSPVQTIMANTHKIIQACERNKVKLELATLIRFGGFESNLSEVPTGNPDNDNIIRFKENGKTKYLETPDPAIKRAIEAMHDKSEANWLTKTLRATAGFIRSAYTMLNPDFAAGNVFRDLPDAFIHNKQLGDTRSITGMIQAWSAMMRALPSAIGESWNAFYHGKFSEDFIEWQMNGGAQASFVSEDVDYIQRSIDTATNGKRFSGVLDTFQKLSELSENVTRLTSYKVAKANLAKAGKTGVTGKQLAALAAREASVDFSKAGRATRTLNKAVIFTNAAVQGINQWVEAFRELRKGNKKPLANKVFRAMVNGVLVAAVQFFAAHFGDDDDKKAYEQAPDWEKETYWIFPAINFRFPKGMDIGIRLFANLTDEALGAMFDGKSMNAKRIFWDTAYNALPSLTATIVTPAVEVLQNYSYFRGAPIDPKSEQHLPAHMRYDETTSGVAKGLGGSWLAKLFSDGTGWSPRKIDYLINGYLGFMGRFLTHLPNYGERAWRGELPVGFDEFPITRRFTFTPYKNPKIVKEFYEAYDEQEQLYNEYKLTKERPDDYNPALHKRIKAAYESMHKISKQETTLLSTPDINHDELKSKLQDLEKRRIAIAERVFQGAR